MAKNDFKAFATDRNANVMSQEEWEALPALISGFTAGKASSAQVNKAIRQASFIAAALAQYTANKSGLDVLDDADLNGFITKMTTAFGKDFQALDATLTALAGLATGANKLPYFTGTDTAAQTDLTQVGRDVIGQTTVANLLSYLGLGEAAKRNVGTETNQIPDMASFASGPGWMKFPSGKIIQYGYHTSSNSSSIVINFPIPFPTQCYGVTGGGTDASAANIVGCQVIDKAGFFLSAWLVSAGSVFNRTATNISWIAIGI
ncbi:phage tail protein [Escherichia coli]|nr:phage tail protein [Escherichia coli]EFH3170535.1 phage tail protein [Escherichia coli]EFM3860699.1 phage tail protein [Escherichia coli]EHN7399221.1 phage tail protein [Escherichia coli]EKZ7969541.1 phage tail protein [Escherichia coli]